jgi:hypothetical protein
MSQFKWNVMADFVTSSTWYSVNRNTTNLTKTIYQDFGSSGCLYADVQVVWAMSYNGDTTTDQNAIFSLFPRRVDGLDIFITYPGQRYPQFTTSPSVALPTESLVPVGSYIGSARGFIANHGGNYCIGTGAIYLSRVPLFPSGQHRISLSPNLDIEKNSMTVDIRVRTYTLGES